jgi:hypothetical protein
VRRPGLVIAWWTTWILIGFVDRFAGSIQGMATGPEESASAALIMAGATALWLVPTVLAFLLVHRITSWQVEAGA